MNANKIPYLVTVEQLVPDSELDYDDRNEEVAGKYVVFAAGSDPEEDARDEFHSRIPIACLDDFEIEFSRLSDEALSSLGDEARPLG